MATLQDINTTLKEQLAVQQRIDTNISDYITERRQNRLAELETLREASRQSRGAGSASRGAGNGSSAARGGFLGGLLGGAGAGLGNIGGGLLGAASGGLAMAGALGLALPAFFGGLMAGEAGLDWLASFGAGFDFDSLKAAAVGFSDIITSMDPQSFIVLAGIMGISAVGGRTAAAGVGFMGIAISAFLGGLLAGEAVFDGFSLMGATYNFDSLQQILAGFSDAILGLDPQAAIILAGIIGMAGFTGVVGKKPTDIAVGMSAIAAGISGFFGGFLLAEGALDIATMAGADLNFDSLSSMLSGFSTAIGGLTEAGAVALAGIVGLGVFASFIGKNPGDIVKGMSAIGAGIAGLMIGLTAGDVGISWLQNVSGATGDGLVSAFEMFNASVGALSETALTAFGAILGAGMTIGALTGAAGGVTSLFAAGGIGIVMAGIGAGIAGLMIGLTAGEVGVSWLQRLRNTDSEGLVGVFKTFNDSILNITPAAIERIKDIMQLGGLDIAGALGGLSAGIIAFFSAEGLVSLGQTLREGVLGTIDLIFGTNLNAERPSAIQQMVDGLKPLENFDLEPVTRFSNAVGTLVESFTRLTELPIGNIVSTRILSMMRDIGGVLGIMPYLLRGGYYRGESLGYGDNIDFGPEGSGGLLGLRNEDIDALREGIGKLYGALDLSAPTPGGVVASNATATASPLRNNLEELYVENLTAQRMAVLEPPVVVNNVDNSTSNSSNTNIRPDSRLSPFDMDHFMRRGLTPPFIGAQ